MKKTIWIWNHYATNMYEDKSGRHYNFAKFLKDKGYKPIIFCADTFHNKDETIDLKGKRCIIKTKNNIKFVFIKTSKYSGNGLERIKNMLCFFINLFPVTTIIKKLYGKPDLILASSVHPFTLLAGLLNAKRLNIPCICEIRDLWPEAVFTIRKVSEKSLIGRLLIAGEYWIYKNANALIFTKEGDVDYLKEKKWTTEQGGKIDLKKCHHINNGVDVENFNHSIRKHELEDEDLDNPECFNVIYAGMVRPVNNVGNILDCAKLLKEHKEIKFLIYGNGSDFSILEEKIYNEKILNVKLKGFVEKKYIPYILSKSNVNILNYSQSDFNWTRGNSSNKLFEYMASGKPIISTVKMGYCLIMRYKCGISISQCNPADLAKAILEIKNLRKQEYHQYCINGKKAAYDFDYRILTEKLIKVIETIDYIN